METPQTEVNIPQEQDKEKKRSPWLIILLILLILMMGCCIIGAILCRGTSRLPDLLDRIITEVPGNESGEYDFWGLVEDIIDDPEGFFPEGDLPEMEEFFPEDSSDESICNGLSGNFEIQVLVGPAEAVDLTPFGIGSIPFSVEYDQGLYLVRGDGTIDFEDQLEEVWGTFTVFFDMLGEIDGVCTDHDDGAVLDFTFYMTGDQVFIVDAPGMMEAEYPKAFDYEFDYSFPVVDGATESGESWALILQLD